MAFCEEDEEYIMLDEDFNDDYLLGLWIEQYRYTDKFPPRGDHSFSFRPDGIMRCDFCGERKSEAKSIYCPIIKST